MSSSHPTLSQRALNRALLARQMLLERVEMPVPDLIEHLVALQAQVPVDPYVCLWSRLVDFDPMELSRLMVTRAVARAPLLRTTIHLCTGRDLLAIRKLVHPVLERNFRTGSPFGRKLVGMDIEPVLDVARAAMDERPRTRIELRTILGDLWPDRDRDSLANMVSIVEPVVQVTPRGLWGGSGQSTWARLETWLGQPMDHEPSIDRLVLRYLGAFGPASVMDFQSWSGMTKLKEVFERLRPKLRVFRSESGKELFDLPDAPRPDPDRPAPIRYLPQYDNILLGHADRSRIVPDAVYGVEWPVVWVGTFLVDGMLAGTWRIDDAGSAATLELGSFAPLTADQRDDLLREGEALTALLRPTASARDFRFVGPG